MPSITHRVHTAELRGLLRGSQGAVARDIFRRGHRVATTAKLGAPVDTGRLRASINVVLVTVNGLPTAVVGTNVKYAVFVMRGTGLFGPRRHVIVPTSAKVLVFRSRGAGGRRGRPVFVRSVRGQEGRPFLQRALLAARD